MTTYFPFTPNNRVAPHFSPAFDGQNYTVTALWNISAQRYYLNCIDIQNNLVFMLPMIESQSSFQIDSLEYDNVSGWVIIELDSPHNVPIGTVVVINIINCAPTTYNGSVYATALSATQIQYTLPQDLGTVTTLGQVDMLINIIKGYFTTSTLVFRNKMFEVNP
jgi:hypothetical protein